MEGRTPALPQTTPRLPPPASIFRPWVYKLCRVFMIIVGYYSVIFNPIEFAFYWGLPMVSSHFVHNTVYWVIQIVYIINAIIDIIIVSRSLSTAANLSECVKPLLILLLAIVTWVPWDFINEVGKSSGTIWKTVMKFAILGRSVRGFQFGDTLRELEKQRHVHLFGYKAIRILEFMFCLVAAANFAACALYFSGSFLPPSEEKYTWFGLLMAQNNNTSFMKLGIGKRYITSLYFSTITLSTIGYGDLHAVNEYEMLFVIVSAFIGMIYMAYYITCITNLAIEESRSDKFHKRLAALKKYAKRNNLPDDLVKQIEEHIHLQENDMDNAYLKHVPISLRRKISQHLYLEKVGNISLFHNIRTSFIKQIVNNLHEEFFLPGEVIMEEGDVVEKLYIDHSDQSQLLLEDLVTQNEEVANVSGGNCRTYGEMSILYDIPQPLTVRVKVGLNKPCTVLWIDKKSFRNILKVYPSERHQLLRNILMRDIHQRPSCPLLRRLESHIIYELNFDN